ncbi:MAG: bifunctional homocysteine S-methyltransferase/methylenetetrahydrofolate reductase [Chloroflexi bacterium]|nr:bifunctional homocysteine S-methyltransferase/methylenetetrahydrofolate reductase [Chloroflexota bacterium]
MTRPRHPFLDALDRGVILADGATGTELLARGWTGQPAAAVLDDRELVRQLHEDYIEAGADLIFTNSFTANPIHLGDIGLADRTRDVNFNAARIARDAREIRGVDVLVGGSVGPIGRAFAVGTVTPERAHDAFAEQIGALIEGGVDLLVFETFLSLVEARVALAAAREITDIPVVVALNFVSALTTSAGEAIPEVVAALGAEGADVVGVNCGVGPRAALDVLEQIAAADPAARLFVMPNAGLPRITGGRPFYPSSPEYFADFALRAKDLGAAIIGGCCGTTPAHTRAMRAALDSAERMPATVEVLSSGPVLAVSDTRGGVDVTATPPAEEPPEPDEPSRLRDKLAAGQYVVSVEIDPPRGHNPRKAVEGARMLRDAGADAINIGDSPMARVRMSALALALRIEREVGIETIIHQTTRDRNLMALQSDLLGAHSLGIRNLIALTGDPLPEASQSSAVWDVDAIGFVRILKRLNEGVDFAGNSLGRPTDFFVACAANPTADDIDIELRRVRAKLDEGGDMLMTQPVYDLATLTGFFERLGPVDVPVLLGILPLMSSRHTEFIHNELAGVVIPDDVRARMREAGDAGAAAGLEIAFEQIEETRDFDWVSGIYIMPSFGRYEVAAELIERVRATAPVRAG